jgi:hypothetical protein
LLIWADLACLRTLKELDRLLWHLYGTPSGSPSTDIASGWGPPRRRSSPRSRGGTTARGLSSTSEVESRAEAEFLTRDKEDWRARR